MAIGFMQSITIFADEVAQIRNHAFRRTPGQREHDDVASGCRIPGRPDCHRRDIFQFPYGVTIGVTCAHDDVMALRRPRTRQSAANSSTADNRDLHVLSLVDQLVGLPPAMGQWYWGA
jgi:hypothetical protein